MKKACVICEKEFDTRTQAVTCSPGCSRERRRWHQRKYALTKYYADLEKSRETNRKKGRSRRLTRHDEPHRIRIGEKGALSSLGENRISLKPLDWIAEIDPGLYLIGKDGSLWKQLRSGKLRRLKPSHWKGYLMARVVNYLGKEKCYPLSHLVLRAFGGSRPLGNVSHYRDGNAKNCAFSNLEWRPPGHLNLGEAPPGRRSFLPGERNSQSVLTESEVLEIRDAFRDGATSAELGETYGISQITAYRAAVGESWAHLPGAVKRRKNNMKRRQD